MSDPTITLAGAMRATAIAEAGSTTENEAAVQHLLRGAERIEELEKELTELRRVRAVADYALQDQFNNRLMPRVVDIAFTAFMKAKDKNDEDGGPTDWFTDTRPVVMKAIEKMREGILEAGEPA